MSELIHKIVRSAFHLFWIFPIKKNRIIFTAYKGAQFSCNPKYIFIELYNKHKDDFEFVWCLNDASQLPAKYRNIKIIKYKSLKYIYYQLTSNVVILNHANPVYIPLRKSQLKINTWHGGGAYKKVRLAANGKGYKYDKYRSLKEVKDTDYFISACSEFTNVMRDSLLIDESCYLNIGMPRNDLFFKETNKLSFNIKEHLNIKPDNKIVLFAPTYRGVQSSKKLGFKLDAKLLIAALEERFGSKGKWLFLLRTHLDTIRTSFNNVYIKDVTLYPDMQELLLITDILITDYSSSIWDYALTKKIAFLYTPDLNEYITNRGFYTPIDEWQYSYAENMDILVRNILEYNEEVADVKIENHLKTMGSYETGNASNKIVKIILNHIK